MLNRPFAFWSRSLTWRLMAPVGLMLLLVLLLSAVSLGTRMRRHHAYDALTASQDVRTELTEIRSLSRSLQRDALNLLHETDPSELDVLHAKYRNRTAEMRRHLQRLVTNADFVGGRERDLYLTGQQVVISRLREVARLAERGSRGQAWSVFRAEVRPNERAASRIADDLITNQQRKVAALLRRTAELEQEEITVSMLASVVLFATAASLTLLIARRSVLRPLSDIEAAMTLVAGGDTAGETPHVDRPDEIGRMARAIEVFRASVLDRERLRIGERQREREAAAQTLAHEQARRRADEATAGRSASLARSAQALEAEVSEVLVSLRSSSGQLSSTSRDLTRHSSEALLGLNEVGGAVSRAVSGATDIAAATDQFTTAIADASRRTRRSADLTAGAAAQSGVLAARMARVQEAARQIEAVVNLIAGIAEQTHLLALNATIEAARAGEAGQGFVVVAGEVKQLARQTAHATDEIAAQIAEVQTAACDAADSLRLIEGMVAEMAREADLLAHGIAEQAQSGQTINRNLTGAAADLDLIDGRVRDVAEMASGVDGLAGRIKSDASLLETMAGTIDRALSTFFTDLEALRASIARQGGAP